MKYLPYNKYSAKKTMVDNILFAYELFVHMMTNKDIYVITGDLGYGFFDIIRDNFPDRFINVGAAEQAMMGVAVGLALEGKTVFTYTITPFYLRCLETIRLYVDHEKIPVIMVGSGRNKDYAHDGFSHDATDFPQFMGQFQNIARAYPDSKEQIPAIVKTMIGSKKPAFLSLRR